MSWGTCYSGSNNIHFDFPPLMEDSRLFSNYYSSVLNDTVFQNNKNIKNNSDYRKYLQVNADAIIQNNQYISCIECGTTSNYKSKPSTSIQTPYIFNSILSLLSFGTIPIKLSVCVFLKSNFNLILSPISFVYS